MRHRRGHNINIHPSATVLVNSMHLIVQIPQMTSLLHPTLRSLLDCCMELCGMVLYCTTMDVEIGSIISRICLHLVYLFTKSIGSVELLDTVASGTSGRVKFLWFAPRCPTSSEVLRTLPTSRRVSFQSVFSVFSSPVRGGGVNPINHGSD